MTSVHTDSLKGALLSLLGFSLFALSDVGLKWLSGHYSVFTVNLYNLLTVSLIFIIFSPWLGGLNTLTKTKSLKWHFIRGISLLMQIVLVVYAFSGMPLANAYALVFITPMVITLISFLFLQESVDLKKWLAIIIGFAGVLVVLRPGIIEINMFSIAALSSAIFFSITNLLMKKMHPDETLLNIGLLPQISCGAATLCIFMFDPEPIASLTDASVYMVTGFFSGLGFIAVSKSFMIAPAAVAAPFHYVQLLWAIILGYFIFGDVIDPWVLAGAIPIIGSGLWIIMNERKQS